MKFTTILFAITSVITVASAAPSMTDEQVSKAVLEKPPPLPLAKKEYGDAVEPDVQRYRGG
ncbi:uncharacterized protein FIESC28_03467 [Fusarium coffeatum]|uniref:Uncharacterized protein n=1 Tax=Fusarium coffeatum TaxID=231269 RepID=A0A366S2X9_9HYPO|nr:uncharacterized protein FIESC28_03467 [Fusarium coffeatum]RBR23671.1 hypothetical protein FIESC28_03467 [Fusarium coffeatum]